MLKKLSVAIVLVLLGSVYAQTKVVWWDFLGGGDGVRMKSLIDDFNSSHDDIQIEATTLEWGPSYYTKVQTSAAVGESPDIMTYHVSRFPLGIQGNVLRPISEEELASVGLSTADYPSNLIDAMTFDGNLYGVPLDIHAIIMYFNKDILGPLGLLGDDGLPNFTDNLENYNAAMQTIKDAGKLPLSVATGNDGTVWRVFYSMIGQQGASFIEGNEVTVGDAGVKALDTIRNWIEQGYAPENTDYAASIALFTSGEAAMHINGVWEVPTMVDLAAQGELFDWSAVRIPVWFDQPATWADSHAFAIPNDARNPISDEKLAAVLEIMSWMNKNSLFWATAGHIPAYTPVVESADYQAMEPNATYAVLADNAFFDPASTVTGVASPAYDAALNLLVPSINGQLPSDQAIQMLKQELESQLR
ncbi:MAG: extracellular solute-binding protein [Trueperaceae bacterium]|nr:extracellular solute-binding protein [Trueperaceae bacterium]